MGLSLMLLLLVECLNFTFRYLLLIEFSKLAILYLLDFVHDEPDFNLAVVNFEREYLACDSSILSNCDVSFIQ